MRKKKVRLVILALILSGLLVFYFLQNSVNKTDKEINPATDTTQQQTKPDKIIVLLAVQKISRLETVIYNYKDIFNSSRDSTRWFGWYGEWLTLVASGKVVAGIDLSKVTESDITITDNGIDIILPRPEIFYSILDDDATYVQSHSSGLFCERSLDMETKVRQQAVLSFQEQALKDNILDEAYKNSVELLKKIIINLRVYNDIDLSIDDVTFGQKTSYSTVIAPKGD